MSKRGIRIEYNIEIGDNLAKLLTGFSTTEAIVRALEAITKNIAEKKYEKL